MKNPKVCDWIKPGFLHDKDNWTVGLENEWHIAKLMRLFGTLLAPAPEDSEIVAQFERAMEMAYATVTVAGTQQPIMKIGTIEEELDKVPANLMEPGLKDFLVYLLTANPEERPTARQALEHAFFSA